MEKYAKKTIALLLVAFIFMFLANIGFPVSFSSFYKTINNKGYYEGTCFEGKGKTSYIISNGAEIYNKPEEGGKTGNLIDGCSKVTVYCSQGGYSKVSKVSDKWISNTFLVDSLPDTCSNEQQTTTDAIDFKLNNPEYKFATGYDEMYSNKDGKIIFKTSSLDNVAIDDQDLFNIVVSKGTTDVTSKFDISKEIIEENNIKTLVITLSMKSNGSNDFYEPGAYSINVSAGLVNKSKSFNLADRFYNFVAEDNQITNYKNNPSNRENIWRVDFTNLENIELDKMKFSVKNIDTGVNCTNNFQSERIGSTDTFELKNKRTLRNRPKSGNYRVTYSYSNPNFSNERGTLTYEFDITIGGRSVSFDKISYSPHRYIRSATQVTKTVEFISKTTGNNPIYKFKYDNSIHNENEATTKKTLKNSIDLNNIPFDKTTGLIAYNYNNINIIKVLGNKITYVDNNNSVVEGDKTTDKNLENAYNELVKDSKYKINATDGTLSYKANVHYVEYSKVLETEINPIYAISGGQINFKYSFDGLDIEDFSNAKTSIIRSDETTVDKEHDGFSFKWEVDSNNNIVDMTIDFDNLNAYINEDYKYEGSYNIKIEFDDTETIYVPFELVIGDYDYYISSQYDDQGEIFSTPSPPGNKKIKHFIGFSLISGDKVLTKKNAQMIDVRIYDHEVDYDENKQLYYYDTVNYNVTITKKDDVNKKIYYTVSENNGQRIETSSTFDEFKNKYADAYNKLNMYKFNADGTINTTSDNYELLIRRMYFKDDQGENGAMVVEYSTKDNESTTIVKEYSQFAIDYPDMTYNIINYFNFDENGYIRRGSINGSYKVTEYNNKKIEGHDYTNLFDIVVDKDASNVEKAISIVPKTEVAKGMYFVYVSYNSLPAEGYLNNKENAIISKEKYPEMWNRNTHMTSIEYDNPEYEINIHNSYFSNSINGIDLDEVMKRSDKDNLEQNESENQQPGETQNEEQLGVNVNQNKTDKMYYNVASSARIMTNLKYIYDLSALEYKIEYQDPKLGWIDATNNFNVDNHLRNQNSDDYSYIQLNNKVGQAKKGKYKVTFNYLKNGFTATDSTEFDLIYKYYDLDIQENTKVEFIHNFTSKQSIYVKTKNIDDLSKIKFKVQATSEGDLTIDTENKVIKNKAGKIIFTYEIAMNNDYNVAENEKLYTIILSNVTKEDATHSQTPYDDYNIVVSYQEGESDLVESEYAFSITEDKYVVDFKEQTPIADDNSMRIKQKIETKYIERDNLENVTYSIMKYDIYDIHNNEHVNVSTEDDPARMFNLSIDYEEQDNGYFNGILTIELIDDTVDLDGNYYIHAEYMSSTGVKYNYDYDITKLRDLFKWDAKLKIQGKFDEETVVDGFYNNISDTTLTVKLDTPHLNKANWVINKECTTIEGIQSCNPDNTASSSLNDKFTAINNTQKDESGLDPNDQTLTIKYKDGITNVDKLEPGIYSLIVYYTNKDFKILLFEVHNQYVSIDIKNPLIYSKTKKGEIIDGMFANKNGYIYAPVSVKGVGYDEVSVNITNANGDKNYRDEFTYDSEMLLENHILFLEYNSFIGVSPGTYVVSIIYESEEGITSDELVFKIHSHYFNFEFIDMKTDPDPLSPNAIDGGKIDITVETEDIPYLTIGEDGFEESSNKYKFTENTAIYDSKGNDVTYLFKVDANNIINSTDKFELEITYDKNSVSPGVYKVSTYYDIDGKRIVRETNFVIGDYNKDIVITKVECITTTNDNRIHKNIGGIYRVFYYSEYDIIASNIITGVIKDGVDVTNKFTINNYENYIDFKYDPSNNLDYGDMTLTLTYVDDTSNSTVSTDVHLYATYKDLILENLNSSNYPIYADLDNQYYTFNINKGNLTDEEIERLKVQVYDEDENLVYSNIRDVENLFDIEKNNQDYKVNIIPFKADQGTYSLRVYLQDEEGEYIYSDPLVYTIDAKFYKVTFNNESKISPKIIYGENKNNIYDRDGASVYYKYTSTYPSVDGSEYSIKVIQNKRVIKEIKNINYELLVDEEIEYIINTFDTGSIPTGEVEIAVCINGLKYNSRKANVLNYIETKNIKAYIDDKELTEDTDVFAGFNKKLQFKVEPANATDTNIKLTTSDRQIAEVENGYLKVKNVGLFKLTISNSDKSVEINLNSKSRLSSDLYEIIYGDDPIIYIKTTSTLRITKDDFMSHLMNVVDNYKVLTSKGEDVTNTYSKVSTGMKFVNGLDQYTVVLIGDVTGDGTINILDVAALFQHIRSTKPINNKYSLKAADIRKVNNINVLDVSSLFQFIRGTRSKI